MCDKGRASIIWGKTVKNHNNREIINFITIDAPNNDEMIHIIGVRMIKAITITEYRGENRFVYIVNPLKKYAIIGSKPNVVII